MLTKEEEQSLIAHMQQHRKQVVCEALENMLKSAKRRKSRDSRENNRRKQASAEKQAQKRVNDELAAVRAEFGL